MKQGFYKFAPAILTLVGLLLGLGGYLIDEFGRAKIDSILWTIGIILQMSFGLLCGMLIQKLIQGLYNDALTGIRNRRYFYEKLTDEMARVKRNKSPLSLVMIDVDNFKGINDRYGHTTGDMVLKQLAIIFKESTRGVDTVARWGGEEFAIILPETSVEGANMLSRRLRKKVQNYKYEPWGITISIGIVSTNKEIDLERFVVLADQALYKAKEKKNAIVVNVVNM